MRKLLIYIFLFVGFFFSYKCVFALDVEEAKAFIYYTDPIIGEKPNNTVRVKIEDLEGNILSNDNYEIRWIECDYIENCSSDVSILSFNEGHKYALYFNDNDLFNFTDSYDIKEMYYNGVLSSNRFFNIDGIFPLPARKYNNISNGLVKITDISLDSKSTTAVIDETPSFKDLDVSFGFGFTNVDDYVKYKVNVQNNDNDDYMLKSNEMFSDSGYIKYELDFDDGSDIIKSNSDKTFYITVKYVKEVPDEELTEGVYTENNNTKLVFTNNDVVNPSTSNKIIFMLSIFIILIIGLLLVKFNNKEIKYTMMIIMGILMFIPVSISALKEINIGVEADIKVRRVKEFCVQDLYLGCGGHYNTLERHVYNYYPGMKLYELSLDYRNINDDDYFNNFRYELNFTNDYSSTGIDNASVYGPTDLILDSSQGCYIWIVDFAIC